MYELKTKSTDTDPLKVIESILNDEKQADAKALLDLFKEATGNFPVVWGKKVIGFGHYKYRYPTGHKGHIYATGFSVTENKITLHLYLDEPELHVYVQRSGKIKTGKSCIYVNKLKDINCKVLTEMVRVAIHYVNEMSNDEEVIESGNN